MSTSQLELILRDALHAYADDECADPLVRYADEYLVGTFAESGVPGRQSGLVVTIDGAEFQVSITRSK